MTDLKKAKDAYRAIMSIAWLKNARANNTRDNYSERRQAACFKALMAATSSTQAISLLAGVLLAAGSASAASEAGLEYPHVYKDPRSLGMGGVGVAVGGRASSVFTNPAGLGRLDRGFTVDLLPSTVASGRNVMNFYSEMEEASQRNDEEAANEVMRKYRGRNLHASQTTLPSLSWRGDSIAFSVASIGNATVNGRSRQGYGDKGVFSMDASGIAGAVAGLAYRSERYSVGISYKYLERHRLNESYTIPELMDRMDESTPASFENDVRRGQASAPDIGFTYTGSTSAPLFGWLPPAFGDLVDDFRPTFGFSLLNIGGLDFGEAGVIPMTGNVGLALMPTVPKLAGMTLAVDYLDITRNHEEDEDILKRLHLGLEAVLWRNKWSDFSLRTGLYQGYGTAGIELRMGIVEVGLATYAAEVGAYGGQDADRRYLATLNLGW